MREQQIAGSNCLYGRWSWAAVLRAQERLGRKHMALYPLPAHLWLDHIRCVGLEPLKRSLAARQITVSSFHTGKYQYSLFEPGDSLRGSSTMRYYKNCVDGAAALGCARVCVRPAGSFLDGDPSLIFVGTSCDLTPQSRMPRLSRPEKALAFVFYRYFFQMGSRAQVPLQI